MKITAKRHPYKFYLTVTFVFSFFLALGCFMFKIYGNESQQDEFELKILLLPIFATLVISMAFYSVWQYFKNAPIVVVENEIISFGKTSYPITEIKELILTGKMPFRYIVKYPMEGALLIFNDDSKKYIFDDMYSNTWQLKCVLEKTIHRNEEYHLRENGKIDPERVLKQQVEIFTGSQVISLRGISLWGVVVFFLYMGLSKENLPSSGFWWAFFWFGSFWFFLNSYLMHYFGLTKEFLIVKNQNLLWRKHIYRLSDVQEVVFESSYQQPNCMRIITKDFRNKLYPAANLRDYRWLELKAKLEHKGITVRNECIW